MSGFKSHFVFNRSQRNGIFLLLLIIILLQVGYFFIDFSSEATVSPEQEERIVKFQKQIDSLKKQNSLKDTAKVFPFNPNYITDYKGYTLGMSVEQIDRLHAYRARNQWVNTAEDFQRVTGVSDSLLKELAPLFTFPEWAKSSQEGTATTRKKSLPSEKISLNHATPEDLQKINGVGGVLSQRIVNYRESIGGFNHEIQLNDVYGLSPEVVERISRRFTVEEPVVKKQDVNSISVISLSELPYFNYELARKVVSYRDKNGEIRSFEDLADIKGFPRDKITRIKLYLSIN